MTRVRRLIVIAALASTVGCDVGREVSTPEQARQILATHAFEWKDETSLRYGAPAIRNRISFDRNATRCIVSSKFENEDEFRQMIDDEVLFRAKKNDGTDGSPVELTCGRGSYRYVVKTSTQLDVYSTLGNPDPLASAHRL